MAKTRLSELDALRGFAALFVVLFHYKMGQTGPIAEFLQLGVTGVDLFFDSTRPIGFALPYIPVSGCYSALFNQAKA